MVAKEFHLLSYNGAYSVESQPLFRRNMWSPSSGLKCKRGKNVA
jgi:hypothetical protein